tara:strand:+ start:600 stop:2483 length:1884 start_codon:yes stop_codon:yes gene_type:complete
MNKYNLKPLYRRFLLLLIDLTLINFGIILSFYFVSEVSTLSLIELNKYIWLYPFSTLICLPIFILTSQYKGLTSYISGKLIYTIGLRNILIVVVLFSLSLINQLPIQNFKFWFFLWISFTSLIGISRLFLRDLLLFIKKRAKKQNLSNVAIYGAGSAGGQLSASLQLVESYKIKIFLDDNSELWGRMINGVEIHPVSSLKNSDFKIDQILLAIPSLTRSRRREILENLAEFDIPILQVPSIDEIANGLTKIDDLRPIYIEDLLGRDTVSPNYNILNAGVTGKSLAVTGAGGSIGAELCRQIIKLSPKKIVLIDISEPSIYLITQELKKILSERKDNNLELISILGNVNDSNLVEKIFNEHEINILFHAAAYKHVPIVEENSLVGIANNVLPTRKLCELSIKLGLDQFLLISTDKAVRPTNIMGASKRLAEIIVQSFAYQQELLDRPHKTKLGIVRFGNVLGSSGSVVPLFRKQISEGGPVTVTHPEVIRYFMTIQEASQLVLQAAFLAKGGEVFLLDMGEPIKIFDLAKKMIQLSGLKLKNINNPEGDIEIIFTGLRQGEKLYEELLIDAESEPTVNPLIYKAIEGFIEIDQLSPSLDNLEDALIEYNEPKAIKLLAKLVPNWSQKL